MIKRLIYDSIVSCMDGPEIILLIGPRQIGKTTLLQQIALDYDYLNVTQLTMEDQDLLSACNRHPKELLGFLNFDPQVKQLILIDEIQYLTDPTNFLKYLYDTYHDHFKLVVTGSSSFYIDTRFRDSLSGRKFVFRITGFDFREYLEAKGAKVLYDAIDRRHLSRTMIPELQLYREDYIRYGGYPAVVLCSNHEAKIAKLRDYVTSFLQKDIYESQLQDQLLVTKLLRLVAQYTGNLLNISQLSKITGSSRVTIEKYLYVLQKIFFITSVGAFSRSVGREISKMPKIYFEDLGIRNIILNDFSMLEYRIDSGAIVENIFWREQIIHHPQSQIQFWRDNNQAEVDFIIDEHLAYEIKLNKDQYRSSKYQYFSTKYSIPVQVIDNDDIMKMYFDPDEKDIHIDSSRFGSMKDMIDDLQQYKNQNL